MAAFIRLGKALGRKKPKASWLTWRKQAQKSPKEELEQQRGCLPGRDENFSGGARHNVCDKFIGEPILNRLREMGHCPLLLT